MEHKFVIGIDYGTDSCRTVIIDTFDGSQISSAEFFYPRWAKGKYCDPERNQFRQHPLDYIEGLEYTVKESIKTAPHGLKNHIKGIAIATTGSTVAAVDEQGIPLAMKTDFKENPNAMFILWKDHTAITEAEEINTLAHSWSGIDFTKYVGGVYSSEWFWAKILHILREDINVRRNAFSWIEHCDWMPALLTGNTDPLSLKRSRCAAGHKAMWHEEFKGLPSEEFLVRLDPLLSSLRERLYRYTFTSDFPAGNLSKEWAEKLDLPEDVTVSVGGFDAHFGAVGAGIGEGSLIKVVGTSTCDMMVFPSRGKRYPLVRGICGQVDGSILPGMLGMEAGQSAYGDIYAWFKEVLSWPLTLLSSSEHFDSKDTSRIRKLLEKLIVPELSKAAERIEPGDTGITALDWMNGRRTPDADATLKGAITGLSLGSTAPKVFRSLVEATAFGSRRIAERFEEEGITIRDIIAIGGISKKSPFVMQVLSDVLGKPIRIASSEQTVALGAAMFAATAAGIFFDVPEAQKTIGRGIETEYQPNWERSRVYESLYQKYLSLGSFVEKKFWK
jgi:L-ribulokinase